MADEDSVQERTEKPTEHRLKEAREKGQVVRSRDLSSWIVLILSVAFISVWGGHITQSVAEVMTGAFQFQTIEQMTLVDAIKNQFPKLLHLAAMILPVFAWIMLANVIATTVMGGWTWSNENLIPNFSRLNPISGIKKVFSLQSLFEAFKSFGKFIILGFVAYLILKKNIPGLIGITELQLKSAWHYSADHLRSASLTLIGSIALVLFFDVPYQIWQHFKKLKMTKEEIKEEMKNFEGRPEVRGRIRQVQREMSRRRMMQEVPKADVIIVNPTHYAVALRYDQEKDRAPILVAKGVDLMALQIQRIAKAHQVVILSAPPLARSIYHHTEFMQEITPGLYVAVAQVMAYVYELRRAIEFGKKPPKEPDDYQIPDELQR
jgi:flagellar biosynthetic protein FlhB